MKWLKAAVVGLLGSLVMFVFIMLGIHVTGIVPFNVPPSGAFLTKLGLDIGPLPLIVHFGYGAFWSIFLVFIAKENVNTVKGILLALGLWLFMMIVYSPFIGWGFFGFGGEKLAPDSPLYLEPGPKYLIATFVLHLIYGTIIGWFNKIWSVAD